TANASTGASATRTSTTRCRRSEGRRVIRGRAYRPRHRRASGNAAAMGKTFPSPRPGSSALGFSTKIKGLRFDSTRARVLHSAADAIFEGGSSRMTWTRRHFLTTSTLAGAALAAGRPRHASAQGKPITVAHSVSTFVYGKHLVAREKKFFDEEGVRVA